MATARLCKAKTCHASVFATHYLAIACFRKQAMSAGECILENESPKVSIIFRNSTIAMLVVNV
jgi:hypothetical protein